ncbi:MAG: hypothetical protein KDC92_09630 [Bacteroidetes bacterium]|nr:hypothetical protein [Bacteroidota bacterium]
MIEQLQELCKVHDLTFRHADNFFIETSLDHSNKLRKLLNAINENENVTDHEAESLLYGRTKKKSKNYMMLRVALRDRLLNYVYLIKPNKVYGSTFMVDYFQAQKGLFLCRALVSMGFYRSGIDVALKTLKLSEKLELWDIVSSIAGLLSDFYSARNDEKKFRYFDEKAFEAIKCLTYERKTKHILQLWHLKFFKIGRASKEDLDLLKKDIKQVERFCKEQPSTGLTHFLFRLKLIYFEGKIDYHSAIKVCNEAITFLQKSAHANFPGRIGIYLWSKMFCYLNLRDFRSATEFAEKGRKYFVPGTLNWFSVMEYYFVLSVQTNNYKTAYKLIVSATSGVGFKSLPMARQQKWMVLQAYMELIISTDIWKDRPDNTSKNKFKINRFINEVDFFKNDKTGLVVSILILHIMFKLHYGQYVEIIDKRDALSRYIRRYLYTNEHQRSRLFLTMLKRVIESDFSYARVVDGTSRLLKSLQSKKISYAANYGGNEIVDYEILWNWLLGQLKAKPFVA